MKISRSSSLIVSLSMTPSAAHHANTNAPLMARIHWPLVTFSMIRLMFFGVIVLPQFRLNHPTDDVAPSVLVAASGHYTLFILSLVASKTNGTRLSSSFP